MGALELTIHGQKCTMVPELPQGVRERDIYGCGSLVLQAEKFYG